MGNSVSHRPSGSAGKVILSDGTVHEYGEPLTVAELMLEHPQQMVVEFDSAAKAKCSSSSSSSNTQRPIPLPADKELEMKKVYIMLPMRRGKPAALSSEESRQLLSMASAALRSRSSSSSSFLSSTTGVVPFFARVCAAVGTREGQRVAPQIRKAETREIEDLTGSLEGSAAGAPEYLNRQFSGGKGWKPKLDTITEKVAEQKLPHWMFKLNFR